MSKGVNGLVHGWGLTDVSSYKDGTRETCPFYRKWVDMVKRVHSKKYLLKYPSYDGCSIDEQWKKTSVFKNWMMGQNWEGLELDKDILHFGNKVYSPETCVFVPEYVNSVLLMRDRCRGAFPVGVKRRAKDKRFPHLPQSSKYCSSVNNGDGKYVSLGTTFTTPEDAHRAWQVGKKDAILRVLERYRADECHRDDVSEALMSRVRLLEEDHRLCVETLKL